MAKWKKIYWKCIKLFKKQYSYDLKDGYGEFTYENGSSYKGMWKAGK